jgi:hypothetical protein
MTNGSLQETLNQALSLHNLERRSLGIPAMEMSQFLKEAQHDQDRWDDKMGALTRYPLN